MIQARAISRQKENIFKRWFEADYPGGTPRFQINLFLKDAVVYCVLPVSTVFLYKIIETSLTSPAKRTIRPRIESSLGTGEKNSQIISFSARGNGSKFGFSKRAPGTLVKVRLLNVVETSGTAPVHAQIIDNGLGKEFLGGTLLGEACPEMGLNRINIDFHFVRLASRADVAVPITARALSLDGTFGINANKKEGFFARAAIRGAATNGNTVDTGANKDDFRTLVARSVAAGLMQEFQSDASVAHNNAQVLTLQPATEFYVELTDFFPGQK